METPYSEHGQSGLDGESATDAVDQTSDTQHPDHVAEVFSRFFPGVEIVEEDDILLIRDKS